MTFTWGDKERRITDLARIVKAGGAPFGPPINGTIGEVVAAYQTAVQELKVELAAARDKDTPA